MDLLGLQAALEWQYNQNKKGITERIYLVINFFNITAASVGVASWWTDFMFWLPKLNYSR